MRLRALTVLLAMTACGPSPCERLAPRLMPDPEKAFIERCETRYREPAFARTVDCLLAIEEAFTTPTSRSAPAATTFGV